MKTKYHALWLRLVIALTIVVVFAAGLPARPVLAAPITYNFQVDAGNPVATGVVTNDEACDKNSQIATITLMDTASHGCASHVIKMPDAGPQNILDVWFNTPYAASTTVTGTSVKLRLREQTGGAGSETWTAGFMLMYMDASGTITNFTGAEATRVVANSSDVDHTVDLSAQSALVPSGSKLGLRIRAVSSSSSNMEVYYGSLANVAGTGASGILIVQEVQKLAQTINVTTAAPTSAAYGSSFTVGATATSGLSVSYSAGGSCTVVGATFTMTSSTGVCVVKYDQAGNGSYDPAPQVTSNVNGATRTITVTADAKTKTFGASDPALTYTYSPALVGVDAFSGSLSRVANEAPGPHAITQGTLSLSADYVISYVGANLTINPIITGNAGASGVQIQYGDGGPKSVISNSVGAYSLVVPYGWSGSITPSRTGYIFVPTSYSFTNVIANQLGQNFVARTERTKNGGLNSYVSGSVVPQSWSASGFSPLDGKSTTAKKEGTASVKINGASGQTKTLMQTLLLSGNGGEQFTFSFWIRGTAVPTAGACRAQVILYNGTTVNLTKTINCATSTYAFQKKLLNFTTSASYTKIVIKFTYAKSSGAIWLDGVSLIK